MRGLLKFLAVLIVVGVIGLGGAYIWAGRSAGPAIQIRGPERFVGQQTTLDLVVDAPAGRFSRLDVSLEQNGRSYPVFNLNQPTAGVLTQGTARQESSERLFVMRPIGKRDIPQLQAGPAKIVVTAGRPVLYGLRTIESSATRDVQVQLEPPRVSVLSTFHYVNHGGAEFVVYRATPENVTSGVRVGNHDYPGFPASSVGIKTDPAMRVAFFALLHDQDLKTPVSLFARDPAGNEVTASLDTMSFPKPFSRSRIPIDDRFLSRVVPAIASNVPDMNISTAQGDLLPSFLTINGELRRKNAQTILDMSKKTTPEMLWREPFQPLANASVEAKFADNRTYVYQGKDVDQQVHLGFDLAVTQHIPVLAANRAIVLYARDLGIYGNCVILDHGLGVQSLYGHLSSISVKPGDRVEKGQQLGLSGMTGLAAGDHLHFTMLVDGQPVNPVEWWDLKWMQDRVFRKITAAGGTGGT